MNWKKTRLTLNVWQDADFKIVENPEESLERRYRLDVFGQEFPEGPEFFASLDAAKRAAATLHQLALMKAENERLRIELDERRQADAFERHQLEAELHDLNAKRPAPGHPQVTALAAELVEVITQHETDELARLEAEAGQALEEDGDVLGFPGQEHDPWFDGDQRGVPHTNGKALATT
jgi:hypothetical protein